MGKKKKNLNSITSVYQLFLAAGVRKQEALVPPSPRVISQTHENMAAEGGASPHMAGSRENKGRLTSLLPIFRQEAGR